jgi:hypothetical protein
MLERRTATFGIVVVSIALLQAGLYMVASHFGRQAGELVYFDPRIGIAALTDLPESGFPNEWEWSAVGVLAAAAGAYCRPAVAAQPSRVPRR